MHSPTLRIGTLAALVLALVLAACGGGAGGSSAAADDGANADGSLHSESPETSPTPAPGEADTAESPATAAADAGLCALVPVEHVEAALGMATDGGVADDSLLAGGTSCRFTGNGEHLVDVQSTEQDRDAWFDQIDTAGLTDEAVAGVGEEAYRAAETALGGPGARFTAWADGRDVWVTIYSETEQDVSFAAAQAIAEAVLAASD